MRIRHDTGQRRDTCASARGIRSGKRYLLAGTGGCLALGVALTFAWMLAPPSGDWPTVRRATDSRQPAGPGSDAALSRATTHRLQIDPASHGEAPPPSADRSVSSRDMASLREIVESKSGDLPAAIRQLKRDWGKHPPVADILAEIMNRQNPLGFRIILIDGLGSFKRAMSREEQRTVLLALESLSTDNLELDQVRIVAGQRYAGLYLLLTEVDGKQAPPDRLYQAMIDTQEGTPLRRQLITSLATAGDPRVQALAAVALRHPETLDADSLRNFAGVAAITKDTSIKESLSAALAVAPDVRSFTTTVYALGEMFDYQVMAAFNEHYRYPEGKLLINHILYKNHNIVERGMTSTDLAVVLASVGAAWKINDDGLVAQACQAFNTWDRKTQQAVLSALAKQGDPNASRLAKRMLTEQYRGEQRDGH